MPIYLAIHDTKGQSRGKKTAKIVSFDDDESETEETSSPESTAARPSTSALLQRNDSKVSILSGNSVNLSDEEYVYIQFSS